MADQIEDYFKKVKEYKMDIDRKLIKKEKKVKKLIE